MMVASVTIEDLPLEVLSAIFERLPFEQLHRSVKLVCKKWYWTVLADHLHPRSLLVEGSRADALLSRISRFKPRLSRLKFSHVDCDAVAKFFDGRQTFANLKTLSIVWKRPTLSSAARLSAATLCSILDRCPKLNRLNVKNCSIAGRTGCLAQKIAVKRIRRVAIWSTYHFLDEVERFYELARLEELRISSCVSAEAVRRVCATNGSSLLRLGVHIGRGCAGEVLRGIGSCAQLRRLRLSGRLPDTAEAWAGVANLSNLRFLRVELGCMPVQTLVDALGPAFVRRLHSLGVRWMRRVHSDELECLSQLRLAQLSLAFVEDDEESGAVLAGVVDSVRQNRRLRRLKVEVYVYEPEFVVRLCGAAQAELRYARIHQICGSLETNNVRLDMRRVAKLISLAYNLDYTISESVLEIVIEKKM